jgi:hypothetical protein
MNIQDEPRMYLILREDLAYKYIQGGHALAEFALKYPQEFKVWNNEYLICLSVFNGLALADIGNKLENENVDFVEFWEPDLHSDLPTAMCLFDDGKNKYRKHLEGLRLASK